jgi:hypothetical protein
MSYVVAGYSIVLGLLFLYGVNLAWRRRRWTRVAARVEASHAATGNGPAAVVGDLPSE